MNFTYEGADWGKVIKNFSNEGNNFRIEYLDNSVSSYTCSNENERQRIIGIMIEQAIVRDENFDLTKLEIRRICSLVATAVSLFGTLTAFKNSKQVYFLALMTLSACVINEFKTTNKEIKELKKYKLFLELASNLKEVNDSELLKCIEFDKIYQKHFDITTLDDHSYNQVKAIYKAYKTKCKSKKNI